MGRLIHPQPDRSYLQTMEIVEYDIGEIRKVLRLGSDDPDPNGFKSAVAYARHLHELLKFAAIAHDRAN